MPERDDIGFGRRLILNSVTLKVVFVKQHNLSGGPCFFPQSQEISAYVQ